MTEMTQPAGDLKSLLRDLENEVIPALSTALDIGRGEAEKIVQAILPDLAEAALTGQTKLTAELEAQIRAAALVAHRKIQPRILTSLVNVAKIALSFVAYRIGGLAILAPLLPALPAAPVLGGP